MPRRTEQFTTRQIAGALLYAVFQTAWLKLKSLSWAERFVYGSLVGLPLLYLVIFIRG